MRKKAHGPIILLRKAGEPSFKPEAPSKTQRSPTEHMQMIEDTIQIRCSSCKSKFKDKARRILTGHSRQCPYCESVIFFDEGSPNEDIREAVRNAALVRKALKQEEADQAARAAACQQADQPIKTRRPINRSLGRANRSVGRTRSSEQENHDD